MGQEIACVLQYSGISAGGKALLESSEILFRGKPSLKIPFSSIKEVKAKNGELRVRTADGVAVFQLGEQAEKWRKKILKPKSVIEKLGVKSGDAVTLYGPFEDAFRESLKKSGAQINSAANSPWTILTAEERGELRKVKKIAKGLRGAQALWIVYPKGQQIITEHDVRGAGLKAGLTDVKVASFSPTHTALKFVIPKERR